MELTDEQLHRDREDGFRLLPARFSAAAGDHSGRVVEKHGPAVRALIAAGEPLVA